MNAARQSVVDKVSAQQASAMPPCNDKHKIIEHYDTVSPYYRSLWGEHLYPGYWIRGDESKERAQLQLIEHLAKVANVKRGSDILDIGCGFGASSLYLAKRYAATGITISPLQVEIAINAAAKEQLDAKFLLMDAKRWTSRNNSTFSGLSNPFHTLSTA